MLNLHFLSDFSNEAKNDVRGLWPAKSAICDHSLKWRAAVKYGKTFLSDWYEPIDTLTIPRLDEYNLTTTWFTKKKVDVIDTLAGWNLNNIVPESDFKEIRFAGLKPQWRRENTCLSTKVH